MRAAPLISHRFIRNKNTGEYLRADGSWAASCEEARSFLDTTELLDCCQANGLFKDIQLLVKPSAAGAEEMILDLF